MKTPYSSHFAWVALLPLNAASPVPSKACEPTGENDRGELGCCVEFGSEVASCTWLPQVGREKAKTLRDVGYWMNKSTH